MATETKAQTEASRERGRVETNGADPRSARAKISDLEVVRHHFDRAWDKLGYPDDIRQIFWEPYREVTVQIPVKTESGTRRSSTATGSSTTELAVPTRAASASTPRSTSTRSARSPR